MSVGLWDANPTKGIRRNAERARDRFLQAHELPRFYTALTAEPNDTIRDYFLLSLLTGARRANVLAMKWAIRLESHFMDRLRSTPLRSDDFAQSRRSPGEATNGEICKANPCEGRCRTLMPLA